MDRLGGEAQVSHHGDAGAHQPIDNGQGFRFPALEFDGGSGAVLQHLSRCGHGLIDAALVTEEGQIRDDQRLLVGGALQPAAHGPGVHHHLLQGHREGGGMAEDHHRQRVAHQDGVRPGLFHEGR